MSRILIIDDEDSMRHMLSIILKKEGYDVMSAENGRQALNVMERDDFDFVLCDIRMPDIGGIEFLKTVKAHMPEVESVIIMMSAYGAVDTAIECMKLGAYDYISKPFKTDEVLITLKKAEERERLRNENFRLRQESHERYDFKSIIAKSSQMNDVFSLIKKVSDYNTTVLITGESGTGKELVARAIHYSGVRKDKPFIAVNCGAIPETLLESELFGHMKGAFTDAVRNRSGLFEDADRGTIFLDEIGDLPRDLQVKLLRVIQEGELRRVGDSRSRKIDVRVIAATAKDLFEEIKKGGFREDLFYRLNVVPIALAPLRERRDDIPLLVGHFVERYSKKFSRKIKEISPEAMESLMIYSWPGNVRELENVIERAIILADSDTIRMENLPLYQNKTAAAGHRPPASACLSIKKASAEIEKDLIKRALEITHNNRTKASLLLEISHRALLYKMKEYGL